MLSKVWLLLLVPLWAVTAAATDNHQYRDDEYAPISNGMSPNGRWLIAAHGGGEYGDDGFGLYLFTEPENAKVAPIPTGTHLDTGPISLAALWAPDSRHVAILYRSDRHVLDLRLFSITHDIRQRVHPIDTPDLLTAVGGKYLEPDVPHEPFSRFYRVTWQKSDRFTIDEYLAFDATTPVFRPGLKGYVTVDRKGPERAFTYFSASATGHITSKSQLHFTGIKPAPEVPRQIIYSPHLLFDSDLGLHDTETTLSSMSAPKSGK